MTLRGYLRTQGASARMRFVTPGNDADDASVRANAVIFDSNANEYLQVYVSGTVQLNSDNGGMTLVAPWSSLGYVPFVFAAWRPNDVLVVGGTCIQNPFPVPPSQYTGTQIAAKVDGLYADSGGFSTIGYPVFIDYIVFRKDAG